MPQLKSGPADGLCVSCRKDIPNDRWCRGSMTCSNACKNKLVYKARNDLNAGVNWSSNLSTGQVGAIQEMAVCADLMKRGISVFRAVSPSSSCDLIAMLGTRLVRVEVTTGWRDTSGRVFHAKKRDRTAGKFDLLAVASKNGLIQYEPPIETMFGGQ